ncbi:hypothetical protein BWI97_08795 [Siphonobacter sp. BAB-5405]|uniref:hypothetical protein n=1 Tax=Siphonobacter sp. BAB-5405 TaxID=1864825 RepID=UPI000C800794|nr:hypothetical protein [Siphonobacter sp. BAB-5405]PMD97697.1 hypothetical protein BWI97_08795 [Siphonobacter sp. BAB-5405]
MPIDYSKYHPKWKLISRLIRFTRAANCCETCGVENARLIIRQGASYRYASDEEVAHFTALHRSGINYWKALKQAGGRFDPDHPYGGPLGS